MDDGWVDGWDVACMYVGTVHSASRRTGRGGRMYRVGIAVESMYISSLLTASLFLSYLHSAAETHFLFGLDCVCSGSAVKSRAGARQVPPEYSAAGSIIYYY